MEGSQDTTATTGTPAAAPPDSTEQEFTGRHGIVALIAAYVHSATSKFATIEEAVAHAAQVVEATLRHGADIATAAADRIDSALCACGFPSLPGNHGAAQCTDVVGHPVAGTIGGEAVEAVAVPAQPVVSDGAHNVNDTMTDLGQGQPVGSASASGTPLTITTRYGQR